MNDKPYILSVDDEEINQDIINELLEEHFEITNCNDGQQCLDVIANKIPDAILLDVNMPILNGLETCKKIRENSEHQNIPIIFVSALTSSSERLAGYDVGGDDYVTKPFDEEELKTKIKLLISSKEKLKQEQQKSKFATDTAMSAMSSASEIGIVIEFMRSVLAADEIEQLKTVIFESIAGYGLSGCIMLTHLQETQYLFTDDNERQIEKDILKEAHRKGKIIEFSGRAIFNTEHAAILIRKMPEDEDKVGRLKDHIAIIVDALESKLQQIISYNKKESHYNNLDSTINSVSNRLKSVMAAFNEQQALNTGILGDMLQKVEETFTTMGLEESQEELLIHFLEQAEKETEKIYSHSKETSETFDQIIYDLSNLLEKHG